jgi:hypothetical protein
MSVLKGATVKDLKAEVETVGKVMRQKPDIRSVIIECQYRE